MEFEARFGIVGLLVMAVLAILAIMFLSTGGTPTQAQMREALERELDRFRAAGTVMCGVVPKGGSRFDAIRCARTSIGSQTPFLVVFQVQGVDSDVWSGLAGSTAGHVQMLTFDSSPHGQPQTRAEYFVTSRDCVAPTLAEDGPGVISCRNDVQRAASPRLVEARRDARHRRISP